MPTSPPDDGVILSRFQPGEGSGPKRTRTSHVGSTPRKMLRA